MIKINVITLLLLIALPVWGQDYYLDSLEQAYEQAQVGSSQYVELLVSLAQDLEDPQKKLAYSDTLIAFALEADSSVLLFDGYLQKGSALRLKSDLTLALEHYFLAAGLAIDQSLDRQLGITNIAIADVYSIMNNHKNAINYYNSAINQLRKVNDSTGIASALLNAGDEYFNQHKYDSAMGYFEESRAIFQAQDFEVGVAYAQGNIGMIYAKKGQDQEAITELNEAITTLEKFEDYYPIAVYMIYLSDIYMKQANWGQAMIFAEKSLDLARIYGLKEQISTATLQLSHLHERVGNLDRAFDYYKQHITYKDSVSNLTSVQRMANQRSDFEIAQKQIEVDLLNQQRRTQRIIVFAVVLAAILIGLLAFGLFRRYRYIKRTNQVIEEERNRSEKLLLNILPAQTADELKEFGKVKARKFDSVTVLFTDFEGFTKIAENSTPEHLVEDVDFYFSKFDEIIERHQLEKIKTVGDAYMCAGGLPFPSPDHARNTIAAASEMAAFVESCKQNPDLTNHFNVRIGINTGPVIAGVVGTKKFAYDIWGDAVNIAARMETNCEPGKINVSDSTYQIVKDYHKFSYRGELSVKNHGQLKMYYLQPPGE